MSVPLPENTRERSEIGGYPILDELVTGQSWLATAEGGRRVVLKALDEDCLWKSQLHPNVRDRLARVRELAHVGVANLYGVEREGELAFLVWEHVDGATLDEYARSAKCTRAEYRRVARELVLAVEMLHARGLVHGGVKASNVIVDRQGGVVLTHVSPLLYTDPDEDVLGLVKALTAHGESDAELTAVLDEAANSEMTLRRLALRLGALIDAREAEPVAESDRREGRAIRRRALMGAVGAAVAAVLLFAGISLYANQKTPKAPEPPEAPAAAMRPVPRP